MFSFNRSIQIAALWQKVTLNYYQAILLSESPGATLIPTKPIWIQFSFFRTSFCCLSVLFTLFDFCNFIHNKLDLGFEPIGGDRSVWNNILFDKSRFAYKGVCSLVDSWWIAWTLMFENWYQLFKYPQSRKNKGFFHWKGKRTSRCFTWWYINRL